MSQPLKTHFNTASEAEQYLTGERFERVFNRDSSRYWISDDGMINAELMGGQAGYIVEYVG